MKLGIAILACSALLAAWAAAARADAGGQVWQQAGCGGCHTLAAAGATGAVGPNLDQLRPSAAAVAAQVRGGGGGMPSFAGSLTAAQIAAVAAFVSSAAGGGAAAAQPAATTAPNAGKAARGAWVRSVQVELARLGFFHGPTTGFYGPLTTAAVRAFQQSAHLTADGVCGPSTKAALRRRLRAAPPASAGSVTATTAAGALPPPAAWVRRLQVDLARLGLFRGPFTGVYGPLTTAAVRRFQAASGLAVDGRWGPASQAALVHRLH